MRVFDRRRNSQAFIEVSLGSDLRGDLCEGEASITGWLAASGLLGFGRVADCQK